MAQAEYWLGCNQQCHKEDLRAVSPALVEACIYLVQTGRSFLQQDSKLIVTDLGDSRRTAWATTGDRLSYFEVRDVDCHRPDNQDSGLFITELRLDPEKRGQIWQRLPPTDSFPPVPEACNTHTLFCQRDKDPKQIEAQARRLSGATLISEEKFREVLSLPRTEGFRFRNFKAGEE